MKKLYIFLLSTFTCILSLPFGEGWGGAFAQKGALDLTFNAGVSIDDVGSGHVINAIAVQNDGKILVGGWFLTFDSLPMRQLVRLNTDGSLDTTFHIGQGGNGYVDAIAIQSDGKIIVGGGFDAFNLAPSHYLCRLNADGSVDASFNMSTGFNNYVSSILLQPNGKIIYAGAFTTFNGTTVNHICRLNTNGTLDNAFGTSGGANGSVNCMAFTRDKKIVLGGDFTLYGSNIAYRVARIDSNGVYDSGFNSIVGANTAISSIAVEDTPYNNVIIAGVNLTNYNLQSVHSIACINSNGSIDASFYGNSVGVSGGNIGAIKILDNNDLLIAGSFSAYNGINSPNGIVQLAYDNFYTYRYGLDTTFSTGAGTGVAPLGEAIQCLSVQPADGKIIIGGSFTSYNGTPRIALARLYNCTTDRPDSIHGNSNALCGGTLQTYFVTPISGAARYEWTLPNGWSGTSDSASIMAVSNGNGGTISVRAFSDSCGWSSYATRAITTVQPPAVPLCMVTVDTQSTHNIIIWEKPQTNLIDSFRIYREIMTNVYSEVGSVPYDSLSEYHDYAADPNVTSYRYKLSVVDTCGAESALSDFHNTIHLQNLGGGNFQWTFYEIEPGVNPVSSFNVYCDPLGNGNFSQIGFIPGTNSTFTDIGYSQRDTNALYVVDVNWGISCNPTRQINTTRSNIRHKFPDVQPPPTDSTATGIADLSSKTVGIYPNPANSVFYVRIPQSIKIIQLQLLNALGQTVWSGTDNPIPVAEFPKGVYALQIETNAGRVVKKVIITTP